LYRKSAFWRSKQEPISTGGFVFFIRSFKYRQSAQRLSKLSVQFKNSPSRGRFISELEIDFLHYSPVRIWKQIKKDGQILFQTDHPVEPELYLDG